MTKGKPPAKRRKKKTSKIKSSVFYKQKGKSGDEYKARLEKQKND